MGAVKIQRKSQKAFEVASRVKASYTFFKINKMAVTPPRIGTRELKQTTTTTATKTMYISLPSSAKQQREMTKFCGVYETWTTPANCSHFHLEWNAVVAYVAVARF